MERQCSCDCCVFPADESLHLFTRNGGSVPGVWSRQATSGLAGRRLLVRVETEAELSQHCLASELDAVVDDDTWDPGGCGRGCADRSGGGGSEVGMRRWYVARTKARSETRAEVHLRRQGFEVYLPQYAKQRRHARRTDVISSPLFPRYLFLRLDLSDGRWHSINSTVGVQALLCHGEMPAAVPEGVVEELRTRETGDGLVPLRSLMVLEQGQRLRIVNGPLHDRIGVYEKMTGGERVVLLLQLLGREVRVAVPLSTTRSA